MASSVIHMSIAKEINKTLKRDSNKILIGSIAPDISKLIGETKVNSHFLESEDNNIPNIDKFLKKYKNEMNDDFVIGYFIHLYTDYLWFKYFVPDFFEKDYVTKLDGTVVKCRGRMLSLYIYNDYTNLNKQLIDEYNIDISALNNEIPPIKNIIEEIPIDKIEVIINEALITIENSKLKKDLVFNIDNIKSFIEITVKLTIAKLQEIEALLKI